MRQTVGTRITTALVVVAAVAASLALAMTPADASTRASAGDYYSLINSLRTSRGLPALQVDGALAASASVWANHMMSTSTLSHDPNLGSAVAGWSKIGENVGTGPTTDSIWNAFLNSPAHLGNLLDPAYTHMGVAVVVDSRGTQWTAHRFTRMASAPAPAPAPTPAPAPAPAPTAPPSTAPPVTAPANPGDTVDCTSFATWEQANHWFLTFRPYYGDVGRLDDDGDGVACELLPGAPVPVVPVTVAPTPPPTAAPTTAAPVAPASSSDLDDGGDGGPAPTTAKASADPDRVAEVIDALRVLEA